MPAAAVIPAPVAYIKVVAVEKLVVGSREKVVIVRSALRFQLLNAVLGGGGPASMRRSTPRLSL